MQLASMYGPSLDYTALMDFQKVVLLSYTSSLITDTVVYTPFQRRIELSKLDQAKLSSQPRLITYYVKRTFQLVSDPNRLLLLPFRLVFLYSGGYTAGKAVVQTLDEKSLRAYSRKRASNMSFTENFLFPFQAVRDCQKEFNEKLSSLVDEAEFYSKKFLFYGVVVASTLFGSVAHACVSSVSTVLNFRRAELDHMGRLIYPTFLFALRESHRRRGFYGWFPTCLFVGTTAHLLTYGIPISLLFTNRMLNEILPVQSREKTPSWKAFSLFNSHSKATQKEVSSMYTELSAHSSRFVLDWLSALSLCALGATASVPFFATKNIYLRDSWLQTLYNTEVRTYRQWFTNEKVVTRAMYRSTRKFITKNGLGKFLCQCDMYASPNAGVTRTVFRFVCRKSIPFGFSWAVYRGLDSSLTYS